jgi:LysM repeat protein
MTAKAFKRAKIVLPAALLILALILPASVQAGGQIHIVRRGENLTQIAARYGTTVRAIVMANRLPNPNLIYAGQRLYIPTDGGWRPPGCGCLHIVRRGETLSQIAWRYGTSVWTLARMNGLRNPNYIWAGQRLCVPCGGGWTPSCSFVHVVRPGETLYSIAWRYGTCVQNIAAANGLYNPNLIFVGQRLCIW